MIHAVQIGNGSALYWAPSDSQKVASPPERGQCPRQSAPIAPTWAAAALSFRPVLGSSSIEPLVAKLAPDLSLSLTGKHFSESASKRSKDKLCSPKERDPRLQLLADAALLQSFCRAS